MEISPDNIVYWQWGFFRLSATLAFSWSVMIFLILGSWLITRKITPGIILSGWQNMVESIVAIIEEQIKEASRQEPGRYLPFIATLFLFIVTSNIFSVIPGFRPPTASLSTTAALAFCVFIAVPAFGISSYGLRGYFHRYVQPTPFMLPFNIIGEFSRTVALAIRLFGNIMSGSLAVAILISLTPLFFPIVIQVLGLLIGIIQAYVFAILALVYIASATKAQEETENGSNSTRQKTEI